MEKKLLLLFLYIALLVFVKHQGLMEVQENTGFYIDNIDLSKDEFLETTICIKEINLKDQKKITS